MPAGRAPPWRGRRAADTTASPGATHAVLEDQDASSPRIAHDDVAPVIGGDAVGPRGRGLLPERPERSIRLDLERLQRGRLAGGDVEPPGRGHVGDDVHSATDLGRSGEPTLPRGVDDRRQTLRATDEEQAPRPVRVETARVLAPVAPATCL